MPERVLSLVALVLLAACTLSPQRVSLEPELAETALPPGLDRTVALAVEDARADPVVGSRGGVYAETAQITTGPGFAADLREALAGELERAGYLVLAPSADADVRMRVRVLALDYALGGGPVVREVTAAARLALEAQAGGRSYSGEASIERGREFVKTPSKAANEALLNELVSAALGGLLADERLHEWLARLPVPAARTAPPGDMRAGRLCLIPPGESPLPNLLLRSPTEAPA